MANKMRGELELKLLDKSYTLRPTFEALCEMEEKAGLGLLGIAGLIVKGNVSLRVVTAVLWAGIRGGGHKDLSMDQVGELVLRTGFHRCASVAMNFLQGAMSGDAEEATEKNARSSVK